MMVFRHWQATDNWEDCRRSVEEAVRKGLDEFRAVAAEVEEKADRDELEMHLLMRLFMLGQPQDPQTGP